ncbi:MAG: DUF87 domain-containing protein [Bacilli bacterium]|nr:DUF87 domain-containing protein [Bacilli bacterium]
MFDKIVYISDRGADIKLKDPDNIAINLMNLHLIFEDKDKKVLGEVDDLDKDIVKARFLGEIVDGKLIGGTIRKPSLDASIRVIEQSEIPMIVGEDKDGYMRFGVSPFYNDFPVYLDVNSFFSNHFAIFGNTGSGKSCGVTRLFQNMFHDKRLFPYKSNMFLFDSSGEYYNAFSNLNTIDPNYHYRFFSTNEAEGKGEKIRVPIWLLNVSDLALLLQATNHSQLPIIERMLKLALIFSQTDVDATKYKNHLIAKAIMTILYTNETSPNKRNEIFSILASCSTPQFNLEAPVQGIGYTRKFRECFLIDSQGQFSESVLLTEYVSSFIKSEYDSYEPKGGVFYSLDTLEKALNFTLISEGWLRNENTYGDAVTLKVRLHSLIIGDYAKYFDVKEYVPLETYLSSLLLNNGRKYQIINMNFDDVDDDFAKVLTKIFSRLIFEFAKGLKDRASIPFHIIVEEAHRYIQNDTDRFLIGYNIFERIAKEGRKYAVLLGLISQRPVELSDTVISQCSSFLIFKMNHPTDVDYIRKMVPNISDEIIEKQKTLQAGTCLGFGMAFKIPLICKLEMPDPAPWSGNCDVVSIWKGEASSNVSPTVVEEPVENAVPTFTADQAASDVDNKSNEQKPLVDIVSSEPQLTTPTDNNQNDGVPDIAATLAAQPDTKEEENKEIPEIASESSVSSLDTELEDEDEPTLNIVEEADADSSVDDDEEDDDVDDVPDIGVNEDKESPKPLVDITDAPSDNSGNSDGNLNTNVPTTDTGKPLITLTDE